MYRVLSWVFPSVAVLALLVGGGGRARAGPLNPLDFTSLGAFPTALGPYTFNTSGIPTLTEPNGMTLAGVVFNGIAVFDFDSINISGPGAGPPQMFTAAGSLPLALLSRTNVTIAGQIDVSGSSLTRNPPPGGPGGGSGGSGGLLFQTGPGGGPGGGGQGVLGPGFTGPGFAGVSGAGGGGFGGSGGAGASIMDLPGGPGGAPYGNLTRQLQGGSGGGGSSGPGGGGGGAIEIGAVGSLAISGSILANGGSVPSSGLGGFGGGGGGSGGGIFLHANSVLLTGGLSAAGGDGTDGGEPPGPGSFPTAAGGGGGGGLVTILFGPGGYDAASGATIDVAGGAGGDEIGIGANGSNGAIIITSVPEPASLVLLGIGLLGVLGCARCAGRRAAA